MTIVQKFSADWGWKILLHDLGISVTNVLRRAGLPEDLFARDGLSLSMEEYFRLWRALEAESNDPLLPIRIGNVLSVETFEPSIFAALCSPNLQVALRRIKRYKKLVMPVALHLAEEPEQTAVTIQWLDGTNAPPPSLVVAELVFFVQLARVATREALSPLKVCTTHLPAHPEAYEDYFGVPVEEGDAHTIVFAAHDAERPFLTANESMWQFFEPELRKRLSQLDEDATFSERVRGVLLELLPTGSATVDDVSSKLHLSKRTLQRRLKSEGSHFQKVLNQTREELARFYLTESKMSGAEISFLLGFDDPNSFFRAFHAWTGETPERLRGSVQ